MSTSDKLRFIHEFSLDELAGEIAKRSEVHVIGYLAQNNKRPDEWNGSIEGGKRGLSMAAQLIELMTKTLKERK